MLSSGMKCYHVELMLSSGMKCQHLELMLSCGANVVIWSYCYHLELLISPGANVIIWSNNPLFYFSWKLHSLGFHCIYLSTAVSILCLISLLCLLSLFSQLSLLYYFHFSVVPTHLPFHILLFLYIFSQPTLTKKKRKFSSYIRKFRWERLQSHIWGRASYYMRKSANI